MILILLLGLGGPLGWALPGAWAQVPSTSFSDPWGPKPLRTMAEDTNQDPVRRNWCPYQKSKLVTFVAACKTEKFLVHSQQPCPEGSPDCQRVRVMYRVAQKPVYQVKQKVLMSVAWRCCPGFGGPDCEHYDPTTTPEPVEPGGSHQEPWDRPDSLEHGHPAAETDEMEPEEQQGQREHLLGKFQSDGHPLPGDPPGLGKAPADQLTAARMEANQTELGFPGRSLEQVLLPHVDAFLRGHLSSIWKGFSDSLQSLSQAVRNLSLDVEANRQAIRRVQEGTVASTDFQELSAKFEAKAQANTQRVDQLQQEVETRLHAQLLSLRHSLSEVQADVDAKLKRLHKAQEPPDTNGSLVAAAKPEPDSLHARLGQLQRNLSELHVAMGLRDQEAQSTLADMKATLAQHANEIKELYSESDESFDQISEVERQIQELQVNHTALRELRVILMEKSLIMEENKEDVERQLLEVNLTLQQLQGGHADLLKYVKDCNCQKLYFDLDVIQKGQKATTHALEDTQVTLDEQRRLDNSSLQALSSTLDSVSLAVDAHRVEGEQARAERARFRSQLQAVHGQVGALQAAAGEMRAEVQRLHGAFASLLQDALRHEAVLTALFGEDALERLTEEEPDPLPLRYEHIRAGLQDAASGLQEQALGWHELAARVAALEQAADDGARHLEPRRDAALDQLEGLTAAVKHLGRCCEASWAASFNGSLQGLRSALSATQRNLEQHQQLFHGLFGNFQELAATNVSLDLGRLQAFMSRKGKKHQKGLDGSRKRDKKHAEPAVEAGVPGTEQRGLGGLWEAGFPVAFYASFSEGTTDLHTVKFNSTSINVGGGYFPEHGYFLAPEPGVYLFAVDLASLPRAWRTPAVLTWLPERQPPPC
uniref:Multimerin 2 n=1 Tax=Oryctolagus cuniculus TaxID=9986 RepID=A0A5F9C3C9_RABIT